jgi:hypothetical protein
MAKNDILGLAKCHVCEANGEHGRVRVKRNAKFRIYGHCEKCFTEVRYPLWMHRPDEVPNYIGKFNPDDTGESAVSLRNVTEPEKPVTKTEPVKEPAPVVKPKQEEGIYGYNW